MSPIGGRSDEPDWGAIRQRLADAIEGMSGAPGPERTRELLAARARRLARPVEEVEAGESVEVVEFTLGAERYAVEAAHVHEVFRLVQMAPVPGARAPAVGVTARRGELLALADLRSLLGLSAAALNDLARVVVIGAERPGFGILADDVTGVRRVPVSALGAAPAGGRLPSGLVRAVGPDALTLLDSAALLQLLG